jgi:predicted methyltransferase MtxX (methanogen marker protein 4)
VRGGQDWWNNGKKMDESTVQSLISNLRELSADQFVDSGFTAPEIEASVTSDGGKRIEKVQIAKTAARYIAKRENDPTLYEISAASVGDLNKSIDALVPAGVGKPAK